MYNTNKIVNNMLGGMPKKDMKSKNKNMYKLVWNGEVIEEDIETVEEARRLRSEYEMAFKGPVSVKKQV